MQAPAESRSALAITGLLVLLGVITLAYIVMLVRALSSRAKSGERVRPGVPMSIISFLANFFDTLGVGSYATTTSIVRYFKLIPDEQIPGSLNVGYVLPTVAEAYIYTRIVPVDPTTLIVMIGAAVLGAWLGAGVVASWSRRKVQIGMGTALLIAAVIMVVRLRMASPTGEVLGLTGGMLVLAALGNFVLGALMTLGIGLYAPCLILIGLLGMSETTAYPIMMGSCAFLMPFASVRFVRSKSYHTPSMIAMALAGIPAVLVAAYIVKQLPLYWVKVLVVGVVTYTAITMLRAARRERDLASAATVAEAQPSPL